MVDQRRIGDWHTRIFPTCSPSRLIAKLMEEVEELSDELSDFGFSAQHSTADEIADVAIVIYAIAHRCGIDVSAAVQSKFQKVELKYAVPERETRS